LKVMSKGRSAPGDLERVRRFVNTLAPERGIDLLGDTSRMASWFVQEGLAPAGLRVTRADLARARALRDALRAMLVAHTAGTPAPAGAGQVLDAAARRARLALRFDEDGSTSLVPEAGGVNGALGRLLATIHDAIAQGTWRRLKACRETTCAWAFYDHTKNRSGAWCSMEGCGNRAKARAYRERHGGAAGS
jgi:predicted RNA-binding Zn ribbon-like protein